eukprot:scaffold15069_cov61-Phaeocystis_antarctica.AAC.4
MWARVAMSTDHTPQRARCRICMIKLQTPSTVTHGDTVTKALEGTHYKLSVSSLSPVSLRAPLAPALRRPTCTLLLGASTTRTCHGATRSTRGATAYVPLAHRRPTSNADHKLPRNSRPSARRSYGTPTPVPTPS